MHSNEQNSSPKPMSSAEVTSANQWALQKAPKVVSLKTDALVECMTNFTALFKDKLFFYYEKCTV